MRVLVATDLCPEADALVDRAARWALRIDAEVHLRAVSGLLRRPASLAGSGVETRFVAREWRRLRDWEWERLEQLMGRVPADLRGTARILQGSTWQALVDVSAAFDLLIVGSAGRTGLARLVLGSVSETVAFQAHCPVLVLPDEAEPVEAERGPLRVCCPVDIATPRLEAASWARDHFEKPLRYELVHALDHSSALARKTDDTGEVVRRHPDADRVRATLDGLAAVEALATSRSHVVMAGEEGPAGALCTLAEQVKADLIAVTTDGRPWLARRMLGSVTEVLIRSATQPVLVAH